jgi:hypothetical protein
MMNDRRSGGQVPPGPAGLCDGCRHQQAVTSARGGWFSMCRLSFVDARFPRYPALPVVECAGFDSREPAGGRPPR